MLYINDLIFENSEKSAFGLGYSSSPVHYLRPPLMRIMPVAASRSNEENIWELDDIGVALKLYICEIRFRENILYKSAT